MIYLVFHEMQVIKILKKLVQSDSWFEFWLNLFRHIINLQKHTILIKILNQLKRFIFNFNWRLKWKDSFCICSLKKSHLLIKFWLMITKEEFMSKILISKKNEISLLFPICLVHMDLKDWKKVVAVAAEVRRLLEEKTILLR